MTQPLDPSAPRPFTVRAVLVGAALSAFLACGAPYGNMVIRGSYMALDFSTGGALFLFFLLVGLANALARRLVPPLALRRGELLVVYIMLITASAIPTLGLTEYLLPIITGAQYYATPENEWTSVIHPYLPEWIGPTSSTTIKWFYEGAPRGTPVPWSDWLRPMAYWAVPILSLYLVMISTMVILRRQWMEKERLIYPIAQVPMEMVAEPEPGRTVGPFFRNPIMWAGFTIPVIVSTLQGLHAYLNFIPAAQLVATVPVLRNVINLIFRVSFPMIGFSYLINLDIAFSLWFFNAIAQGQRGVLGVLGITSTEKLGVYGVVSEPILAHQGQGALLVLVLIGLWVGRDHLGNVFRKALRGDPSVRDDDEIMSYRAAVACWFGGDLVLTAWLVVTGLPAWAALLTWACAWLIFVGLTRIVVESGVATAVGPMISSSVVTSAAGSSLLGPSGMVSLAYTYVWGADIRTFVMASVAHGLKLSENLGRNLRPLFPILLLAIGISLVGSVWMTMNLSYEYGGLNLASWFYGGGTRAPFEFIAEKLNTPTGPNWEGWLHTGVGAGIMALLMVARYRLLWWPLHPIGYPIGAVWLMDQLWFSIFLAWLVKLVVMKYGGPRLFGRTRPFFLGLILGQFVIAGLWLVIDYSTGMTDNRVFWI